MPYPRPQVMPVTMSKGYMNQSLKIKLSDSGCSFFKAGNTEAKINKELARAPIAKLLFTPPNL